MAITNTFSAGVNTSFSSELNTNFTDIVTNITNAIKANTVGMKKYADTVVGFPLSSTTWVRASGTAVRKTTNSGGDWTTKYTSTGTMTGYYRNPMDPDYMCMFLGAGSEELIYSTDGGENWTDVDLTDYNIAAGGLLNFCASITTSGRVYIVFGDADSSNTSKCVYTEDDGSSWTTVTGFTTRPLGGTNDVAYVMSPVDDALSVQVVDFGSEDLTMAYKIPADAWVNYTSNQGSIAMAYIHPSWFFYVDADNYAVNLAGYSTGSGEPIGTGKITWNGVNLNAAFPFSKDSGDSKYICLLRFDADDFVYTTRVYDSDVVGTFRHDSDGIAYQIAGLSIGTQGPISADNDILATDSYYYGVSSDSTEGGIIAIDRTSPFDVAFDIGDIWSGL